MIERLERTVAPPEGLQQLGVPREGAYLVCVAVRHEDDIVVRDEDAVRVGDPFLPPRADELTLRIEHHDGVGRHRVGNRVPTQYRADVVPGIHTDVRDLAEPRPRRHRTPGPLDSISARSDADEQPVGRVLQSPLPLRDEHGRGGTPFQSLDRNLLLGYARTRECSRHRRRRIRLGTSASLLAWRSACTVDLPRRSRLTGRAEVIHDQAEDDAHGRRRRLTRHRRRCRASRRFWSPENGVCASATRAWRRVRSSTSPCGRTPPGSRGSTECRCPSDGEALPLAISPIGSDGRHEGGPCPRSVRIGFSPI